MALTNLKIKRIKPREKPLKLSDGKGLYLLVTPSGGKHWKLKYRYLGKEKKLSLGAYPHVSLAEARVASDSAHKMLVGGTDPNEAKKITAQTKQLVVSNTFEAVGREWLNKNSSNWTQGYRFRVLRRLERDVFPWLGAQPIANIAQPELFSTLRRIQDRGAIETAHRILRYCSHIFKFATITGRAERDICQDLRGALQPTNRANHYASITEPNALGVLLRAIDGYHGNFSTRCALKLSALLFVRPGELRRAEWAEFDFERAQWHIPAGKMKTRKKHIVPLSRQAIEILKELRPFTGSSKYALPSIRSDERPMSENTVTIALRTLGYSGDQMTAHGFRSTASTLLNEQGWNRDHIERQLAHVESNEVRAAYNYAEYLLERTKMMQAWADHLDNLKNKVS